MTACLCFKDIIDNRHRLRYNAAIPLATDAFARVLLKAERERFPRPRRYTRGRGRFWATSRPARDRTARCSLHWRRGGSSRLHPVIPGSAARAVEPGKPQWSAERRAGPLPTFPASGGGEEDKARGRAAVGGVTPHWMRLSALRFPRFCARGLSCSGLAKLGRRPRRENGFLVIASAGKQSSAAAKGWIASSLRSSQ